ncbi:MAG TPA: YbaB/EbfC family nucleoid-associated protein [Anaerovoracaceae bacterium]|nr:YbaB/EbfC family nucleoid-associated protein [Bacillota bacterium]HRV32974.1 YbaB/EbfC family nucleoid-associated protein [Anaerovoracaceae bacterium]
MKAGKRPGGKKDNMQTQMAQLQAMQQKMEAVQAEIEEKQTEATAGGGAVSVAVNGKHQLVSVTIRPDVCDPEDVEMLQDLVLVAANEALRQIDEISQSEMSKVTGGMGLPPGMM